jgi:hypothetical protein
MNRSRNRTRTYNLPVNSRLLCQLSYAGLRLAPPYLVPGNRVHDPGPSGRRGSPGAPPPGETRVSGVSDLEDGYTRQ